VNVCACRPVAYEEGIINEEKNRYKVKSILVKGFSKYHWGMGGRLPTRWTKLMKQCLGLSIAQSITDQYRRNLIQQNQKRTQPLDVIMINKRK